MSTNEDLTNSGQPTIVLVHGAFADGSSWNGVIERLQRRGYTVVAPANPLRGVTADSDYVASVVSQINGPVLLHVEEQQGGQVRGGRHVYARVAREVPRCRVMDEQPCFALGRADRIDLLERVVRDRALEQWAKQVGPLRVSSGCHVPQRPRAGLDVEHDDALPLRDHEADRRAGRGRVDRTRSVCGGCADLVRAPH